jgi:succinate dehydrogenase hydrophobic anchor subunit
MGFVHQAVTALLLVVLTIWLQCGGIAMIITWARGAVTGDIQKLGPFRSAVLVMRVTIAVISLHQQVLVSVLRTCWQQGKDAFERVVSLLRARRSTILDIVPGAD